MPAKSPVAFAQRDMTHLRQTRALVYNTQRPIHPAPSCALLSSFLHLQKGNIRPGWFHIHRAIQTLSILLALAGFILALVSFNVPWTNMTPGTTPHKLYNPHRVLGVIVIALSLLQVGALGACACAWVGGWGRGTHSAPHNPHRLLGAFVRALQSVAVEFAFRQGEYKQM